MKYSKEIIWHFTCYFCKGWWSIADDSDKTGVYRLRGDPTKLDTDVGVAASKDWKSNISIGFSLTDVKKNFYCPHCGRNQEEDQDV